MAIATLITAQSPIKNQTKGERNERNRKSHVGRHFKKA